MFLSGVLAQSFTPTTVLTPAEVSARIQNSAVNLSRGILEEGGSHQWWVPANAGTKFVVRERLGDVVLEGRGERGQRSRGGPSCSTDRRRQLFGTYFIIGAFGRGHWSGHWPNGMVRVRRRQDETPRNIVGASAWAKNSSRKQQPSAGIPFP